MRLVFLVVGLAVFGLLMLSSASAPLAFQKFGDHYFYLKRQVLFGFLPGLVAFWVLSKIDYRKFERWGTAFLIATIVLLGLVFVPGLRAEYGTAQSWINVFGLSFQPSELAKLTFLLYLSTWLASRDREERRGFKTGFVPFAIVLGAISGLILLQPDLGTLFVLVLISVATYFVGGIAIRDMALLGIAGVGSLAALIKMAPYRAQRLTTFLHPELDPQGIGYHINQALLAVGSGGIFGLGFGQSRQKFLYLPEVAGDSIFAIIAEELGFLFAIVLPLCFMALVWLGLGVARRADDNFGKYLAVGIVFWLSFQAFVNMGAMLSLLPITGIPLPFISYGGTALLVALSAAGILVNISKQAK